MHWKELFYSPVKIQGDEKNILIIGCVHDGHDPNWPIPIWKDRGYNSAAEFTEGFISNWNSKANDNTIGFFLGDNCFNDPRGDRFKNLFSRLKFKDAYCLAGNHYSGYRQVLEEATDNIYEISPGKRIIFTPNYLEAWINKQAVVLSHYPLLSWNGQARGSYQIHAHTHSNLGRSVLGKAFIESGARVYEASVELNPFPPSFAEIRALMERKPPVSFDHHDSNTQNPF